MEVKELIKYLEKLDNDDEIYIRDNNHPTDYYDLEFEEIMQKSKLKKDEQYNYWVIK